jgi:hypothetical protein
MSAIEVPTTVNIGQKGETQKIEIIVEEANRIWKKVKDANVPITDHDACDQLFRQLSEEHRDFKFTLPLVLRTMVQTKNYSSKALERYLKKLSVDMKKIKSMDDYLQMQADYLVFLYKATHKHYSLAEARLVKENAFKQLKEEYEELQQISEEAEKEAQRLAAEASESRRRELYKQLLQQRSSDA